MLAGVISLYVGRVLRMAIADVDGVDLLQPSVSSASGTPDVPTSIQWTAATAA
jgi:hypothetical protein